MRLSGAAKSLWVLVKKLYDQTYANRVTGLAAEVTFFAMLSIFPGLLILAAALGSLDALLGQDVAGAAQRIVLDFLDQVLTEAASSVLDSVRELFSQPSPGLLTVAIFTALYTLSSGFASLIEALDLVYGLTEHRSWVSLRVTAAMLALDMVLMLAVTLAVVLGPILGGSQYLSETLGMGEILCFCWDWLRIPTAFVFLSVSATIVYHLAPNHPSHRPWIDELPGGLFAAALGLVVSYGLPFYLSVAGGGNQVVGVLGGGLILMMWLYLISLVLLLGGQLNMILIRPRRG